MTRFYRLKPPFTKIQVNQFGNNTRVAIFANYLCVGELSVRTDDLKTVLLCFCCDKPAVIRLYEDDSVDDDTLLISEHGEITSMARENAMVLK